MIRVAGLWRTAATGTTRRESDRRRSRHRNRRPVRDRDSVSVLLWLMLALTFGTGVVDAAGYLGLDRVFVGNMTGNIVILGMGAVGVDGLPVTGPLLALGAFVAGAAVTGTALREQPSGWSPRITSSLACGAALLALCAALTPAIQFLGKGLEVFIAAASAAAMGTQAVVARKVDVKDITTVVVTSTLTLFAADLAAKPARAALLNRRVAAIAAIISGAGAGALLLSHLGLWPAMALAATTTGMVAVLGHLYFRTTTRGSGLPESEH